MTNTKIYANFYDWLNFNFRFFRVLWKNYFEKKKNDLKLDKTCKNEKIQKSLFLQGKVKILLNESQNNS